jgi:hypothetical protein
METRTVLIDSRDREANSKSTTDFLVKLATPIENVIRVDLRQLIISEGIYNIGDNNGLFLLDATYSNPNLPTPATTVAKAGYIPVGYYTLSQFAVALEASIRAVLDANGWKHLEVPYITCAVNADRKLELYGIDEYLTFSLSFPNRRSALVFGFNTKAGGTAVITTDIDDNDYYWLESDIAMGLETIEYLVLRSPELGNRITTARGVPAYDIVPIPDRIRPLVYTRYEASPSATIAKRTLYELHMTLTKPTGAVLDLRGNDLAIVLEITQTS